ncbi:MAG: mannosyltransferase [Bacteroidia bacterium]|nr:mannosyltransferase [Bacteroidia bacterium]
MDRHLHIVSLNVPWPADCGGSIDMMNRIKEFKKTGIRIHLHYFSGIDRCIPNELNQFCESIHVYKRKTSKKGEAFRLPDILSSGINDELVANLQKDEYPVLLEGIHCTGVLQYLNAKKRKIVVRMHNEESLYYKELTRHEHGLFKKIFFLNKSRFLKKYNHLLPDDCMYACVSEKDIKILKDEFHLSHVVFIPTFSSWQKVSGQEGVGTMCLYHGNLSVPENEKAALWLLRNVFTKVRVPFVIAGKEPSKCIEKMAHLCQHTCLVANPSETEMNDLIKKAHINVLPCFNKNITGIRLKLLHALYEGRHCVVNKSMVEGTGLDGACHIGGNADGFASIILQLYHQPYSEEEIKLRKRLLSHTYNNEENTMKFIQYLW